METLQTKHLLLRPWKITDAEALYTQAHNPIIGKRCGWPLHKSVDESRDIIEVVLSKPHSFAICLPNNTPIGSIGLLLQGESNLPIGENEAEIGYWLGEDFWGKDYVTEAALRVLQYAFDELHLTQLWASAYKENIASQRVLEKCGFRYHHTKENVPCALEGVLRTEHVTCLSKAKWISSK